MADNVTIATCICHLAAPWRKPPVVVVPEDASWGRGFTAIHCGRNCHGEGTCHLTSPVGTPGLRPASRRHFPFERDKRGRMVAWHKRTLLGFNNSLFCLQLQLARRSQPGGAPRRSPCALTCAGWPGPEAAARIRRGTAAGQPSPPGLAFGLPHPPAHPVPRGAITCSEPGL